MGQSGGAPRSGSPRARRAARAPHDGGPIGKWLENTYLLGSFVDPRGGRLIARPGVHIASGTGRYYLGCAVSVVLVPPWFVWGIITVTRAGDAGMEPAAQTRAWALPGIAFLLILVAISLLKPVLHEPTKTRRRIAKGDIVVLDGRRIGVSELGEVARAAALTGDDRLGDEAFQRARQLAVAAGYARQAANLRRIAEWVAPATGTAAGDLEVTPEQMRRVATDLDNASKDSARSVRDWCADVGPSVGGSRRVPEP